jgi:hypothetical protein
MHGVHLRYKELHPLIHVYTGLLPNVADLMNTARKSFESSNGQYYLNDWNDWFVFGKYTWANSNKDSKTLEPMYRTEMDFCNTVEKANIAAMSHYVGVHNVPIPETVLMPTCNYCMYYPNVVVAETKDDSLTMHYHTDFNIGEWYWPGEKFLITATTYFNDDYEGGEIHFCVDEQIIKYRPQAGDILVFPSGSPLFPGDKPYFHGVTEIKNGHRLIARNFLKYTAEGTSDWYDGEAKHGKEEWQIIAKEMAKNENDVRHTYTEGRIEKKYGSLPVWQSPLVDRLYKSNTSEVQ